MRAWLRLGSGLLASCVLVVAVHADGAQEAPGPIALAPADWSGVYVGAQGGGGLAQTGWSFPVDSYFTLPNGRRSFGTDPSGGIYGGHVTWNRQIASFVFGAELAINGSSIEQTRGGQFSPLFPNDQFFTSITGYGTLTGRLGYAHGPFLLYATGGYARAHATYRAVSGPPGGGVIGEVKQHLNGFTFGGGLEFMLARNVVIGAAYDFLRFDGQTTSIATTGTPSNDPYVFSSHQVDINAVSVRVSLKLDQPNE